MNHYAAVIGQVNVDVIFHEVAALPKPGEEVFAKDFKICLGGGPMVIPYHLTKLGVPARFGTFMGDDFESRIARELLESINYVGVEVLPHPATRPIVVTSVLSTATERSFICYNQNADESELDAELLLNFFKGSKAAYFPKNLEVAQALVADGCKLLLDVSWDPNLKLSELTEKLKLVTFFTPNDKEAKHLCGEEDLLRCLDLMSQYVQTPIIKLGRNGALVKVENQYYRIPGLSGITAIDPTGAGDNFLAGLIFGMYLELGIIDSIKIANILGGLATEVLGCYRSDLTRDKVMELFESYADIDVVNSSEQLDVLLRNDLYS